MRKQQRRSGARGRSKMRPDKRRSNVSDINVTDYRRPYKALSDQEREEIFHESHRDLRSGITTELARYSREASTSRVLPFVTEDETQRSRDSYNVFSIFPYLHNGRICLPLGIQYQPTASVPSYVPTQVLCTREPYQGGSMSSFESLHKSSIAHTSSNDCGFSCSSTYVDECRDDEPVCSIQLGSTCTGASVPCRDRTFGSDALSMHTNTSNTSYFSSYICPTQQTFTTFYENGMKTTVIDREKSIYVVDMVSPEVCDHIRTLTDEYVVRAAKRGKTAWRQIYTYTKMDLPCCEIHHLRRIVDGILDAIHVIVRRLFKVDSGLYLRSFREPHLLRYQVQVGETPHPGVQMHFDGSDLTWSLMLSGPEQYCGGGTYFRCLGKALKLRKGQVLLHPGCLFHSSIKITGGIRDLMVCFMDGIELGVEDDPVNEDENDHSNIQPVVLEL